MSIEPDTKDWTWVLERPCDECGFDPGIDQAALPERIRTAAGAVHRSLHDADVRERPDDATWSKLEYAAHVRDVCTVMHTRLALMLDRNDPEFASWDQDATAEAERYAEQDPTRVAIELDLAAMTFANAYANVSAEGWDRTGRRSNGSRFTVRTLGVYALHDLEHHAWDVARAAA